MPNIHKSDAKNESTFFSIKCNSLESEPYVKTDYLHGNYINKYVSAPMQCVTSNKYKNTCIDTNDTDFSDMFGLRFTHINICSLYNKASSILSYIIQFKLQIVCLNETWLSSSLPTAMLHFPGFRIHRLDRPSHGGGVMILVSNKCNSYVENCLINYNIELLHIALDLPSSSPINIISVYRPPSCKLQDFIQHLDYVLSNIDYAHLPLILLGDLNIDMYKSSSISLQLSSFLSDYGLKVVNRVPTRITEKPPLLLMY